MGSHFLVFLELLISERVERLIEFIMAKGGVIRPLGQQGMDICALDLVFGYIFINRNTKWACVSIITPYFVKMYYSLRQVKHSNMGLLLKEF